MKFSKRAAINTELVGVIIIGLVFIGSITFASQVIKVAKPATDQQAITNFQSLVFKVDSLLNNGRGFSTDEMLFSLGAEPNNAIVGFQYDQDTTIHRPLFGPDYVGERPIEIKRPDKCFSTSCLCLYKDIYAETLIDCVSFSTNTVFLSRANPKLQSIIPEIDPRGKSALTLYSRGEKISNSDLRIASEVDTTLFSYNPDSPGFDYEYLVLSPNRAAQDLYIEKIEFPSEKSNPSFTTIYVSLLGEEQKRKVRLSFDNGETSGIEGLNLLDSNRDTFNELFIWYLTSPDKTRIVDIAAQNDISVDEMIELPQRILDDSLDIFTLLRGAPSIDPEDFSDERFELRYMLTTYLTGMVDLGKINDNPKIDPAIQKYFQKFMQSIINDLKGNPENNLDFIDRQLAESLLDYVTDSQKKIIFQNYPSFKEEINFDKAKELLTTDKKAATDAFQDIFLDKSTPASIKAQALYLLFVTSKESLLSTNPIRSPDEVQQILSQFKTTVPARSPFEEKIFNGRMLFSEISTEQGSEFRFAVKLHALQLLYDPKYKIATYAESEDFEQLSQEQDNLEEAIEFLADIGDAVESNAELDEDLPTSFRQPISTEDTVIYYQLKQVLEENLEKVENKILSS